MKSFGGPPWCNIFSESEIPLSLRRCSCQMRRSSLGANMVYSRTKFALIFQMLLRVEIVCYCFKTFSSVCLHKHVPSRATSFPDIGSVRQEGITLLVITRRDDGPHSQHNCFTATLFGRAHFLGAGLRSPRSQDLILPD